MWAPLPFAALGAVVTRLSTCAGFLHSQRHTVRLVMLRRFGGTPKTSSCLWFFGILCTTEPTSDKHSASKQFEFQTSGRFDLI